MNEKLVNMVFKIGLLLIGVGFLVVYYFHSQNGRYQHFIVDTETTFVGSTIKPAKSLYVFDNRAGKVYRFEQERHWIYDYKNGEVVTRKAKWNSLN